MACWKLFQQDWVVVLLLLFVWKLILLFVSFPGDRAKGHSLSWLLCCQAYALSESKLVFPSCAHYLPLLAILVLLDQVAQAQSNRQQFCGLSKFPKLRFASFLV